MHADQLPQYICCPYGVCASARLSLCALHWQNEQVLLHSSSPEHLGTEQLLLCEIQYVDSWTYIRSTAAMTGSNERSSSKELEQMHPKTPTYLAMLRPLKNRAMSWSEDCHGNPLALMTVLSHTFSVLLLQKHNKKKHLKKSLRKNPAWNSLGWF